MKAAESLDGDNLPLSNASAACGGLDRGARRGAAHDPKAPSADHSRAGIGLRVKTAIRRVFGIRARQSAHIANFFIEVLGRS